MVEAGLRVLDGVVDLEDHEHLSGAGLVGRVVTERGGDEEHLPRENPDHREAVWCGGEDATESERRALNSGRIGVSLRGAFRQLLRGIPHRPTRANPLFGRDTVDLNGRKRKRFKRIRRVTAQLGHEARRQGGQSDGQVHPQ